MFYRYIGIPSRIIPYIDVLYYTVSTCGYACWIAINTLQVIRYFKFLPVTMATTQLHALTQYEKNSKRLQLIATHSSLHLFLTKKQNKNLGCVCTY